MSGPLVLLVVAAVGFLAFGLQILSRHMQRAPLDVRRSDPLIDVSRSKSVNVRPAELHQLIGVISNARISEASERTELQPILDSLGATAPPLIEGRSRLQTRARTTTQRSQRIERAIEDLERRWLQDDDHNDQQHLGLDLEGRDDRRMADGY